MSEYRSAEMTPGLRGPVQTLIRAPRGLRHAYLAIFVLSLVFRILLASAARPVLVSDARDYHVLARNLTEGRGYLQVYQGETQAFDGFTFRAFRSPGYPLLLAGLYTVFGWHWSVDLALNIVADVVTQACALLIAVYLFGAGPALLVQVLLAVHVLWTPNPMTESLYTALFTLLALLLAARTPLEGWAGALGFGLLTAAALFVRPITLCVFPALGWRCLRCQPRWPRLPLLGLVLLPSIVSVTVWAMRNHALLGQYVVFTTNFGHHNAGAYGIPSDETFAYFRQQGLNEAEINRELTRLEWNLVKADPAGWLKLWARRVGELFSLSPPWEVGVVLWQRVLPVGPEASWVGAWYRVSYYQYYVTYPLFALGAVVLALRRQGLQGLWMLMVSYIMLHAALSRGDIRLLAPLYPLLCLLPAGLWAMVVSRPRQHGPPLSTRDYRGRRVRR
jgi:hypothetical protein